MYHLAALILRRRHFVPEGQLHHAQPNLAKQVYELLFLGDLAKGIRGGREGQGVCRVLMGQRR